jgi:hypothetical protein
MRLKEKTTETIELNLSLGQLKKIYVALFRQLHDSRLRDFDELDEDGMLLTIQQYLQQRARQAGVDCTVHSQWEAFLGVGPAAGCEQRRGGGAPSRS